MYSDIMVKFLYSKTGLMPNTSKASCCGFLRPYFHFFCSVPLRSCGAYTSPGCHLRYIWRWYWAMRSDSASSREGVVLSRPAPRAKRDKAEVGGGVDGDFDWALEGNGAPVLVG